MQKLLQKLTEAPWETGGIPEVVDGNHVWFTALCFNVLKERAQEVMRGGGSRGYCGFAFSHAQMAAVSTYSCVVSSLFPLMS
jgi:hypothetical protein